MSQTGVQNKTSSSRIIEPPYVLFLGDAADQLAAKTGMGIADWRGEICVGQVRLEGCNADCGLPDVSLEDAARAGAKTVVIAAANRGGVFGNSWTQILTKAIDLGFDLASGLHDRLSDIPSLYAAAASAGRNLHDVRHWTPPQKVATGEPRGGKRLLAVGTDCSVGKMYTALAIEAEMKARHMNVDFRATGQTGILIQGHGVPVDAVVADFISGSIEDLSPEAAPDHWDIIEGQGSLFHPSYAGVSLGLLHGGQPDALVLCHEPTRSHMRGLPERPVPGLRETIDLNLQMARMVNPNVYLAGCCINTSRQSEAEAENTLRRAEDELGVPAVDPMIQGVKKLVDVL